MRTSASRLHLVTLCVLSTLIGFQPRHANAQVVIGAAQKIVNSVTGILKDSTRTVAVNAQVFQNELIRTGSKSATELVFQDQTDLAIGANSEVRLDDFVYNPDPSLSRVVLSLGAGVFRFTSGTLPSANYKIITPTATIGVRGTILIIAVALNGVTTVTVVQGAALVAAQGTTVAVENGFATAVNPGAPPAPRSPAPPQPPAVSEMHAALDIPEPTLAGAPAGDAASQFALGGLGAGALAGAAVAGALAGILIAGSESGNSTTGTTGTTEP